MENHFNSKHVKHNKMNKWYKNQILNSKKETGKEQKVKNQKLNSKKETGKEEKVKNLTNYVGNQYTKGAKEIFENSLRGMKPKNKEPLDKENDFDVIEIEPDQISDPKSNPTNIGDTDASNQNR